MTPKTRTSKQKGSSQELIERSQRDPVWWIRTVLGLELWSKQRSIARSVRDHRQTAVRSCHGPGKTAVAAAISLWFLTVFPDSRVITTATKWSQVKNLLWHEINQLYKGVRLEGGLGGTCLQTELKYPDGRYALGLSTRPGQEESFQGHHAPHILLLYDEASGVPEPVYEAGEGYMTTGGARKLMIGNPTRAEGEFYKAFNSNRAQYRTHHISAFDTPAFTGENVSEEVLRHLVTKQWVEERRKWEGTALWDVKVLGNFSKRSDDTVVSLAVVEEAQDRELLPVAPDREAVIGVDVARFGSDETVIAVREQRNIEIRHIYKGIATTETAGKAIELARELSAGKGTARVVVDDDGVGGGVTDMVREAGVKVTGFKGGETALDPESFPNARSEGWFRGADELATCSLPNDEQLAADLVSPRYKLNSSGQRVVEPKDETKKRLARSPDRADAVLLTFAPDRGSKMEVW